MDGANLEEHAGAYSPPQSAAACYRPFEEKVMFSKLTHSTHTHTHKLTYFCNCSYGLSDICKFTLYFSPHRRRTLQAVLDVGRSYAVFAVLGFPTF